MKKNKSQVTSTCLKYVAPSIVFLSAHPSHLMAGTGAQYTCMVNVGACTACESTTASLAGPYPATGRGTNVPGRHQFTTSSAAVFTVGSRQFCYAAGTHNGRSCKVRCSTQAGLTTIPAVNTSRLETVHGEQWVGRVNVLLALLNKQREKGDEMMTKTSKNGTSDLSTAASPSLLGEITIKLILTELNKVADGVHVNREERLHPGQLTKDQLAVLMDYKGLIKETIRQLREAWQSTETFSQEEK